MRLGVVNPIRLLDRLCGAALAALLLAASGCARNPAASRRLIVLGVDGMDPGFVERH